jgi:hypothetical protein
MGKALGDHFPGKGACMVDTLVVVLLIVILLVVTGHASL